MEETYEDLIHLKRQLNSIEHMIYVSCKFTKTTEMLTTVMENILVGYEKFFSIAYYTFLDKNELVSVNVLDKIKVLSEILANRGITVDLSDYFLIRRLLLSDFDSVGQYRKNLSLVAFVDNQEYIINITKILEFYENLKFVCSSLMPEEQF